MVHFRRTKTNVLSIKRGFGGVSGEFVNSALLYRRVLVKFRRTQTNFPTPETKVRGIIPGKIFEFCIALGEFWYISRERKQNFLSPGFREIVPGKIFELCIDVRLFLCISREQKQTLFSPKRGSRVFPHGKLFNSALL